MPKLNMPKPRLIAMILGTTMCALGLGFFVQHGATTPERPTVPEDAPIQQSILKPSGPVVTEGVDDLILSNITHTSAERDPAPQLPRLGRADLSLATGPDGAKVMPELPADQGQPLLACDVELSATPAEMASVDLNVSAPCLPNERVTVHHSGMMFTETTDENGTLAVNVPALSETAVFIVQFGNGSGNVVVTRVPDLKKFDRVVLQWTGTAGFQLHALEYGAGYGDSGHVWAGASRNGRGAVTTLGNADTLAPQMAEVYSFPSGTVEAAGSVALSIEAEVTAANCGRDINAQTLELRGDGTLRPRDLTLSVPDCGAVGDFLVLNNLVEDLTIAAR